MTKVGARESNEKRCIVLSGAEQARWKRRCRMREARPNVPPTRREQIPGKEEMDQTGFRMGVLFFGRDVTADY